MHSPHLPPVNQQSSGHGAADAYRERPLRKRTFLSGKLVYGDGDFTMDCAVRDISEGGAKIVLPKHYSLPVELYLIVAKYCIAYRAQIMWVNFPARGLRFSAAYPLDGTLPEGLKFLRNLSLALSARSGGPPVTGKWVPEE
jgi:hypothetical protein